MELTIAGGGVIDLASAADLAQHHERMAALLARPGAHFQRVSGSTPTGSGPLVMGLGSPPRGMIWMPQWITAAGADTFLGSGNGSIANVSAAVFAGSIARPSALKIGPPVDGADWGGCLLAGFQIPQTVQFPSKSPVFPAEDLYVILAGTGLAAGSATVYRATCGVIELPATDEAILW